MSKTPPILVAILCLGLNSYSAAVTISLDFESQFPNSSTNPSGWSFADTGLGTGSSFFTTAAGGGSTGTGLGGIINDAAMGTHSGRVPHGILVNSGSPALDLNQNISGTYDFKQLGGGGAYSSSAFLFGNISPASNVDGSSAGQLLEFYHSRGGYGNAPSILVDGAEATIGTGSMNMADNTWYRVAFDWTASGSGNQGDFTVNVTRWTGSAWATHGSLGTTGYTFDSAEAYFGFGELYSNTNGGVVFDNISITGELVPEPSHLALIVVSFSCLLLRRRR